MKYPLHATLQVIKNKQVKDYTLHHHSITLKTKSRTYIAFVNHDGRSFLTIRDERDRVISTSSYPTDDQFHQIVQAFLEPH